MHMMRLSWRRLLTESRRPPSIREHPQAHWFAVATVCIGAFMGQLDASIVTLALPTLQREFHTSLGSVEWVALAYLLTLVSIIAAIGRLADMFGRKLLYTYGFIVFTVGSLLCGLAPSLPLLIGARVLQAVGAAMLQANSVALIVHAMPRTQLGRGIGVQGAAQAVGLALGPALGGFLIALGGWRLIFFINVPVGLVGTALGWVMLPRSRELGRRGRFDWPAALLFMPMVGSALLAISFGNELGWLSPSVLGLWAATAVLGAGFVVRERLTASPMIDLGLFGRAAFSAGISSGLLSYLVTFGTLFVVPFFLQHGQGISSAVVGGQLTALPVALGVVAPFAGRLSERLGSRPLTVGGMVVAAVALALLGVLRSGGLPLVACLALLGAGLGAFTPTNNAAIMSAAPRTASGVAAGLLNMTRGLGTALGVGLTGLVYEQMSAAAGGSEAGFAAAGTFLSSMALLAALLAALGGRR
jgi:EmrB/QacA subfamily drug resistance transporter